MPRTRPGLADALRTRLGDAHLLGRGGRAAVGHRLAPRRRWGPIVGRALTAGVALATGTTGVVLAMAPPVVAVEMTPSAYVIGEATLGRVGDGTFAGDGALVIRHRPDRTVQAASDAVHRGIEVSGECLEDADQRRERCVFEVGGVGIGALDTWTHQGWERRYDDGQTVRIAAAVPIPVPFLAGR